MLRKLAVLPAALMLCACRQEQEIVNVSFDGAGRPVFARAEGSDCLSRYSVSRVEASGPATPVWSVESPMPRPTDPPCLIGFPVIYGEAGNARSTFPERAPALERGRLYRFEADGDAVYSAEFRLP